MRKKRPQTVRIFFVSLPISFDFKYWGLVAVGTSVYLATVVL